MLLEKQRFKHYHWRKCIRGTHETNRNIEQRLNRDIITGEHAFEEHTRLTEISSKD